MRTDETNPQDWFDSGRERLHVSDLAFADDGYACMTTMELLQESVERYFKGWLISQGWMLVRTHDLSRLLHEAELLEPRFSIYAEYADDLTQAFLQSHYPGGDPDLVGLDYQQLRESTTTLLELMQETLPQYQF
jgi:HEPN domain-containing protein